jgi:MOB kinase activator 1
MMKTKTPMAFMTLKDGQLTVLGEGDLKQAVQLPEGENEDEWIAAHVQDFCTHVNLLYGMVTEYCTPKTCPIMSAGSKYEYYWSDGVKYKKPSKLSAPEYVDELMHWTHKQLSDTALFPTKLGTAFPKTFKSTVKAICRRLFRVYAHIYLHHMDTIQLVKSEMHLHTSFKHFYLFCKQFELVDKKEWTPLNDILVLFTEVD